MSERVANDPWVGQDVAGRLFTVAPEDVARYEAGTGTSVARGTAPALCYHSEVFRDLSWYLPNIVGNLHARQEWELFQPFRPGDRIRSRTTVVERYRKRDRLYVVAEVLLTTPEGRWLQRSRTHQSFLADDPAVEMVVDRSREKRPDRRFEMRAEGTELRPLARTITLAMCEAFSGPHKNYHTDREMARMLGFPDVVVQGMLSVCFVADLLAAAFGGGWDAGGKLDVRLVNVVWPDDTITARGRVRETITEGARRRALCDVWCEKGDGTVTTIGTASAMV